MEDIFESDEFLRLEALCNARWEKVNNFLKAVFMKYLIETGRGFSHDRLLER